YNIYLPKLEHFIENSKIKSKYYPTEFPILYFISRWYSGGLKQKFIDILLEHKNFIGGFGNVLNTALAISSLLNFNYPVSQLDDSVNYLLHERVKNHWEVFAFCNDPMQLRKQFVAGSPALTTAFCLEALQKYQMAYKFLYSVSLSFESDFYASVVSKV